MGRRKTAKKVAEKPSREATQALDTGPNSPTGGERGPPRSSKSTVRASASSGYRDTSSESVPSLRERADGLLRAPAADVPTMPAGHVRALGLEPSGHQAEPEIRDDGLRQTQFEPEEDREAHVDSREYAQVGCVTLARDGRIQDMNPTAVRLLGTELRELLGADFGKFLAAGSLEIWNRHLQCVFESGAGQTCEVELRRSGASSRSVRLESVACGPNSHRWCRTVILDATGRSAASELWERTERLRAILDAAADAIVTIDRRGIVVDANPATERMFGYSQEELLGRNVSLLMPKPYCDEHDGYIARYLGDGVPRIIGRGRELVARRRDGSLFPVDLTVTEVDHLGLFTGIVRDISARRRAEEEARFEQQFNQRLVGTAQCIVLVLDVEGRIVQFNEYFERLCGRPLGEVRGHDWFDTFLPSRIRQRTRALFGRALDGSRTRGNVNPILVHDGSERLIEWYDAPLTDADGRLIGLLCTGQDATERRRLEREVLEATDAEQRRIGRDLHDNAGQELVAAALLAHDLERTLCEASQPEAARRLRTILESVERVQAQLRSYTHGLAAVAVDANGLPAALAELARRFDDLNDFCCDSDVDPDVAVENAYVATHLYRIAQEAVTNAVRHGGAHRVTIRLSDGGGLQLTVEDDGSGIADLERAFREGLGLRAMRYRAELIGGSLVVSPGSRGGTVVTCTCPGNSEQ